MKAPVAKPWVFLSLLLAFGVRAEAPWAAASAAGYPKRLARADSFFGIHLDFHAGPDNPEIGRNTTAEIVDRIIDAAHPDYIQIDCKGHPGISSYPTKAGNPAPRIAGDPLRVWREATARRGVALYMHYSGVWDSEAIRQHPDWAAVNADGKANPDATSFFGPYAERLLIPQLRELSGEYGVDGVWVDGECWASVPDYGEAALRAYRAATGFADVPRRPGEPHWREFLDFNREAFRGQLRHYLAEVKKTNPAMQLCSNWAFTDHMPEAVSAPVDWISGDFTPEDSVNSARFSGRYMARQGKAWDLMAWGFATRGETRGGSRHKSAAQLEREAAVVMGQGGGFQSYYNQKPDGSAPLEHLPVIAEVAKFCRARQTFCQGAVPVPQVAFLYSTASHYREINGLFGRDLSRLAGTLQALVESQRVVDVVGEHSLAPRLSEYPLVVVGECDYLEPAFRQKLVDYTKAGGRLLLVGPEAAALFASELDVALGEAGKEPRFLENGGARVAVRGPSRMPAPGPRAKGFGRLHAADDPKSPSVPAATVARLGKGEIAAIYFPFSRGYLDGRSAAQRAFLDELVRRLDPKPMVEVAGSPDVDVSVNRVRGKLAVNLVNASGAHWDPNRPLVESIAPVGPLRLAVRTARKPAGIRWEPGGEKLVFEYRDGVARFAVPRLEIHGIALVE